MTRPVVRAAVAADAPAVTNLVAAAYQVYLPRIGRRPAPMDADYSELIGRGAVWVAAAADEIVGVLVLEFESDHVLLENVAVSPGAQGSGVGGLLIDTAEQQARERGLPEVRLYTNAGMTENLAYYPRRGYTETGRGEHEGFSRVFFAKRVPG
jgi:N-acetylglutamate synthase-like GNAT family acetyltransferase